MRFFVWLFFRAGPDYAGPGDVVAVASDDVDVQLPNLIANCRDIDFFYALLLFHPLRKDTHAVADGSVLIFVEVMQFGHFVSDFWHQQDP